MQRNQWRAASAQLLKHWSRSGISQVPSSTAVSQASAASWLERNAALLFETPADPIEQTIEESGPVPVAAPALNAARLGPQPSPTQPSSRVSIASASNSIAKSQPEDRAPSGSSAAVHTGIATSDGQPAVAGVWSSPPLAILDREVALNALRSQVVACRKCEDIVCRRQQTVFGGGALNARVVMFGEAPGADEDRIGEPFAGEAGQLFDKILVASGMKRPDVYILNSSKCRPPSNRTPTDAEMENCRPFFESQLEAIQPEYIVCWGSIAVRALLGSTDSVGRLRGRFHSYRGAKVLVTYHPSYLLRTPDAKKLTWEDMKMLMKEMGIPIPGKA